MWIFSKSIRKREKNEWDFLKSVVVDNVLAMLWIDNGPITILITIHDINSKVSKNIKGLER